MNKETLKNLTSKEEDVLVISDTGYGLESVSKKEAERMEPAPIKSQDDE
ncbi:hypothetical protein [Bacillus sp. M6-12]|nr:hypothetical protein [Bacillus sp. M6-12]